MFDLRIQSHQGQVELTILKPLAYGLAFDDNLLIFVVGVAQVDDTVAAFVLIIWQIQVMSCCNHGPLGVQKTGAFSDLEERIGGVEEVKLDEGYPSVKLILLFVKWIYFLFLVLDIRFQNSFFHKNYENTKNLPLRV
jgi:hypothetical protein